MTNEMSHDQIIAVFEEALALPDMCDYHREKFAEAVLARSLGTPLAEEDFLLTVAQGAISLMGDV